MNGRAGLVLALVALAGAAVFVLRSGDREEATGPPPLTVEEQLEADDRLQTVLAGCSHGKDYQQDTTDMVRVLAEKLRSGQLDPIRQARVELAALGEEALPELQRLARESQADSFQHGVVENVYGVFTLMEEPWGLPLLREGLGHPQEVVRLAAMAGIRKHGGPEDYDTIAFWLPATHSNKIQADLMQALLDLDPERFCADFATFLEQGIYEGTWHFLAPFAGVATDPDTVARYKTLSETCHPYLQPTMLVPAARAGDAEALEELRGFLQDANPERRQRTLTVLDRAGLGALGHSVLESDENDELRLQAADVVARLEASTEANAWLTAGLSDPSGRVRSACLYALVGRGDARATAEALELLDSPVMRLAAMKALSAGWDVLPDTVERARSKLARAIGERDAWDSERTTLVQLLGQVPGRETAELLLELARTTEGTIRKWSAHRYFVWQIANSGLEGQALLTEALAEEPDILRRIDLEWTIATWKNDVAREVFIGVLTDPNTPPHERVYVAERLVRIGPANEVAPVLKRVALASKVGWVRIALGCLLWTWYG